MSLNGNKIFASIAANEWVFDKFDPFAAYRHFFNKDSLEDMPYFLKEHLRPYITNPTVRRKIAKEMRMGRFRNTLSRNNSIISNEILGVFNLIEAIKGYFKDTRDLDL